MTGTELRIPLRDGLTLGADVYGARDARAPVLLIRTPYGKQGYRDESLVARALERGYVVVVADVRGRYTSQGEFDAYRHEGLDGYDAIEWLATQPWSTGRIATAGLSYPGAVQWLAAVEVAAAPGVRVPGDVLLVRTTVLLFRRRVRHVVAAMDVREHRAGRSPPPGHRRRAADAARGAPVVEAPRTRRAGAGAAPRSAGTAGRHAVLLRLAGPSRRRSVLGVRGHGVPVRARARADLQLQRLARRRLRADRRDAQLRRSGRARPRRRRRARADSSSVRGFTGSRAPGKSATATSARRRRSTTTRWSSTGATGTRAGSIAASGIPRRCVSS